MIFIKIIKYKYNYRDQRSIRRQERDHQGEGAR